MPHKPYKQYQFIESHDGLVYPLHPKTDLIKAIKGPDEWKEVKKELGQFLDDMDELNIGPMDNLLMRMNGVYVVADPLAQEDRIKKRNEYSHQIVHDVLDEDDLYKFRDQPIIGVTNVFDDLEETMAALRKYWNIGYDTVVRDLWANRKHADKKPGWLI